jgi:nucleotide-binding universal stress UspA family protein
MYQKLLVPLDGSERAEAALPHARALATTDSEIVLLRVVVYALRELLGSDPTLSASLSDDLLQIRHKAQTYLEHTAAGLRAAGLTVKTEVVDGQEPAAAILDYAEHIRADVIVMASHGRGGVVRWLLGSVASKIVQGAKIPVLLIHPA